MQISNFKKLEPGIGKGYLELQNVQVEGIIASSISTTSFYRGSPCGQGELSPLQVTQQRSPGISLGAPPLPPVASLVNDFEHMSAINEGTRRPSCSLSASVWAAVTEYHRLGA